MTSYETYLATLQQLAALPTQKSAALREAERAGVDAMRAASRELREVEDGWSKVASHQQRLAQEVYRLAHSTSSEGVDTLKSDPKSPQQARQVLHGFDQELRTLRNSWKWVEDAQKREPRQAATPPGPPRPQPAVQQAAVVPAAVQPQRGKTYLPILAALVIIVVIVVFFVL